MEIAPEAEQDVLRRGIALLAGRLPSTWKIDVHEDVPIGATGRHADAIAELTAPDGARADLMIEAKRSVVTRDLPAIVRQLAMTIERLEPHGSAAVPAVMARYLPPSARQWLTERKISYIDITGNMRVVVDRPALYLRDTGAERDPWRGPGRPRASLQGPPAARVVRALIDFVLPMTISELVKRAGASTGATYRVVDFLERETLIERGARGRISMVNWRGILERWSEDYGFLRSNTTRGYLQPRGIRSLLDDLQASVGLRYALTGSVAAERLAPYAPTRLAMLYADDHETAATKLNLRPVDTGANVLLAETKYDVVFERTVDVDGLRVVAPSQAAVDLLTAPGRGPAEGQALLEWMQTHEPEWRA